MKKIFASAAVSAAVFISLPAQASDVLTGDVKLACEAVLCLSSGDRPHECAASIKRYFDIRHKKFHKTLEARRNFLNLCPSSNEADMPDLVNALVNGAGRCDAAELNRVMRAHYTVRVADKTGRHSDRSYYTVRKSYIRNAKPDYCRAYFDHEWTTAGDKVKYVGAEKEGGRWVDVK